jgi:hypothetical protein
LFQQGLVHSSSAAYSICFIVLFQQGLVHSSSAAYSICFIVLFQRGLVHSSSAAYFIEPVLGQTDVSSGHPHIVYKSSSLPLKFLNTRDHSAQEKLTAPCEVKGNLMVKYVR